ncbi:MAG: DciA family protein [Planctomycetota bacterium]|jgi:predicted nucleic acid-binding Zn ribbon protein
MAKYYDVTRIEPLKKLVKRYLKTSGVGWMLNHRDIVMLWNETVGDEIAAQTRVRSVRNGVLHIDIESSALKLELEQFYAPQLVETMRGADPNLSLQSIRFHLTRIERHPKDGESIFNGDE